MDDPAVLQVRSLSKQFGAASVFEDVSVALGPGERLGVAGPNGSGKTTLLRCISGTVTPTTGVVTIDGHDGGSLEARSVTGGALANERAFYQRLSGWKNLMFYASLRAADYRAASADVRSIVEELELAPFISDRVDRYSSGMFQQLGLARALLGAPKLLVLDEPTRSLDADAVVRFWGAVGRRPSVSLMLASHRETDLDQCTRRIDLS
jgi:ABC-2 type transport system ATP-binding protein